MIASLEGVRPLSATISLPEADYEDLKQKAKLLEDAKKQIAEFRDLVYNLQKYRPGYSNGDGGSDRVLTMLPYENGGYVDFTDLAEIFITDEERAKRKKVEDLDAEIERLNSLREQLINGN